jgi:DNA-directed RNA polymerase sigma subunit (sigma70/sigma32)
MMEGAGFDIDALREEIEKLVLLEEVAERRQQMIEQRLDDATQAGITPETIRKELGLSKESVKKLLDQKTPDLAQRLGISQETADNLAQPIG